MYGPVVAVTAPGALAALTAAMAADQSAVPELPVVLTVRPAQHSFVAALLGLGFEKGARESPCMLVNSSHLPGNRGMYFALHALGSG